MNTVRHLLFALVLPAAATGQDCQILLDRPEKVGDRQNVHAVCQSQQRRAMTVVTTPERIQNVAFTITIDAERQVLAVSAKAQPTKVQLTIIQAVRADAGRATVTLLPPGAVVIMDGATVPTAFTDSAGAPLGPSVQPSLRMAFHLSEGEPKDDQAFGNDVPQHIGASWPINAPAAAKFLQDLVLTADPAKLTGTTTLADQLQMAGQECLRLNTALTFTDFSVPLTPGLEVTTSSATLDITSTVPRDLTRLRVQETRSLNLHLQAAGKVTQNGQQQALSVGIDLKQSNEMTYTAAPSLPPGK